MTIAGCGGSANNFVTHATCEKSCHYGACCYKSHIQGVERGYRGQGHYPMVLQCVVSILKCFKRGRERWVCKGEDVFVMEW